MHDVTLAQVALFLAAAVVAAPLAKLLRIGNVLGYLLVGVLIGPAALGLVSDVGSVLHFAEFGVIMLLFVIGLELRPRRLWAMRSTIFGLGSAQVAITGLMLAGAAMAFGLAWQAALFAGLALSLSSTAFALQVLEEKGELALRHGRQAFAVLLFQDLAAIPLIALAPLFAVAAASPAAPKMEIVTAIKAIAVILAVVVVGRYLLNGMYRLVARTRVKEAMTASALLTVVGVTLVMQLAGLPASLGAFLAGVLLADSDYRHEIVADIAPFEGLLLGLFFTAIGMSLNLALIVDSPGLVLGIVAGLLAIKAVVLFALGHRMGLDAGPARRLALVLSQGGEFAFALFAAGGSAGVLERSVADLLSVAVTLSMAATPLLLALDEVLAPKAVPQRAFDELPKKDGHVVIAGFGRFGQIVARVLIAKRIPVTALDSDPAQVDFVRKFGAQIYYGDASRPEILEAARTGKARAFVLAIDDVDASLRTARMVRRNYPDVPIYARARDRRHIHQLMDEGIRIMRRETFLSALDLTREVLRGLGLPEREVRYTADAFQALDRRRLYEDYKHYTDIDKVRERAKSHAQELEELFAKDAEEHAKLPAAMLTDGPAKVRSTGTD
jgi:glutathione-regulated potassium-efflux system protein KefB